MEFLSKINFFQDFTFLIAVILLTLAVAFLVGRHRLISLLFGIYISLALLGAVSIKYIKDSLFQAVFFLVVVCVITILGRKIIGLYVSKSDFMWRIIVLSFLEVMAILSVLAYILPKKNSFGLYFPKCLSISNFLGILSSLANFAYNFRVFYTKKAQLEKIYCFDKVV